MHIAVNHVRRRMSCLITAQYCAGSEGGSGQLVTNFTAAAPSSYFADLYAKDGLQGGHVIMLGPDPESRWECHVLDSHRT